MKNPNNTMLLILAMIISMCSCSDNYEGITYSLLTPNDLIFSPGEEVTFEIRLTDDTGIAMLDIKESEIGLKISESYSPVKSELEYSFTVDIPENQAIGSELAIGIDITDQDNNVLFEQIKVSIEED